MGFSRPEYCSGQPFPSPGDLPNPGIEPGSPALQADSLPAELSGKSNTRNVWCYSETDRKPPNSSQKRHYLTCLKRNTLATVFRLKGNMVKGRETGEKAMKILTRYHSDLDQGKNRGSENLPDCGYILKAEATKFSDIDYEGK